MPPAQCSVKGCKVSSGTPGVILFRYPPDYFERSWMKMLNKPLNWRPKPNTRMCSLHFPPGSFSGRKLNPKANPVPNFPGANVLEAGPSGANPLLTRPPGANPLVTGPPEANPLVTRPSGANPLVTRGLAATPLVTRPPENYILVQQVAVHHGM